MIKTIAFIILTWNDEAYLANCLQSIFSISCFRPLVFAVDNGSTDKTGEILQNFHTIYPDSVEIISYSENRGTTYPRNRALEKVKGRADWICILDSDTIINDMAVIRLAKAMEESPKALIAVPRMWDKDNREQPSCKKFPSIFGKICKGLPFSAIQEKAVQKEIYPFFTGSVEEGSPPFSDDQKIYSVDYGISACWFMRMDCLEIPGDFDEKIFYSPEDVDYCLRVWKSGFQVIFVSDASIYHLTQRLSHQKVFSKINISHVKGLFHFFFKHHTYLKKHKKMS